LQLRHRLQTGIRPQAVEAIGGNRLAGNIDIQGETIAQLVQQTPFKGAQQWLQRWVGRKGVERQGVMLEQRGMRVFGGDQKSV